MSRSRVTSAWAASDSLGAVEVAWKRTLSPAVEGGETELTPGVDLSSPTKDADRGAFGGALEFGDDLDRVGAAAQLLGREFVADPHVAPLRELLDRLGAGVDR